MKQNPVKNRNKFPVKEKTVTKAEKLTVRCTPEFKKILTKLSSHHKKDSQKFWSESDLLHVALAEYIRDKSPYYENFNKTEKNALTENLMP